MKTAPIRFSADDLPSYPAKFAGLPGAGHLHTAGAQLAARLPGGADLGEHAADGGPAARRDVPAGDGSGDLLAVDLYRPAAPRPGRPLVLLMHGLGGHAESAYMRTCVTELLHAGLRVAAMNFRGCGRSRGTCEEYFHPGRTGDLSAVLDHLRADADLSADGLILGGFSLGGSILLKFLAVADPDRLIGVRAAVTISAPLDLAACSRALGETSNTVYQKDILRSMKQHVEDAPAGVTAEQLATIRAAGSVWALDETFVAPYRGFDAVEDYYREDSAGWRLDRITAPTLLIVAADDPFVPLEAYEAVDWAACPHLVNRVAETGGHSGFFSADGPTLHSRCLIAVAELGAA